MRRTSAIGSADYFRASGFTLVEMLVVLMVVVLVAGSFPLALDRMLPARRVSAAAQDLALAIRQLQTDAASSGTSIHLAVRSKGYIVQRNSSDPGTSRELGNGLVLTMQSLSVAMPLSDLVLYPDGSSSGAHLEIAQGQHRASIDVSCLTGRVRVSG